MDGLSGLFLPGQGSEKDGEVVLRSAEPARVYEDILGAVQSLQSGEDGRRSGKVVLIVDALDLLLATAGANTSSVELGDMLMDLREVRYCENPWCAPAIGFESDLGCSIACSCDNSYSFQ